MFLKGALLAAGVALADTDYRDVGMLGAGVGAQLTNQKFGRDDETEADLYGMRYMVRAGYDPAAAVGLQETFVRLAEGKQPGWLEGLFASHPPSQARVAANRAQVAELGSPGGEVGAARYQRAIARLQRNKPAYAAFDEARKALKKGDSRTALKQVDKAIKIEPREALFYGLRGEIKAAQGKDRAAIKDLDRAVALNPNYFRPLLARGMARRTIGDAVGAKRDLERSLALLPTADGYYGLGRAAQADGRRDQAVDYYRKASTSSSEVGSRAGKALARLDLQDNPERYVKATLGLTRQGYLVLQVTNRAPLAVNGVRVVVGVRSGPGIREQASYRVDRRLAGGESVRLKTDLGPIDQSTARR